MMYIPQQMSQSRFIAIFYIRCSFLKIFGLKFFFNLNVLLKSLFDSAFKQNVKTNFFFDGN